MAHYSVPKCLLLYASFSLINVPPFPLLMWGEGFPPLCHAISVAWTNRMISPGVYDVSNGFTVICLFASIDGPLATSSLFLCHDQQLYQSKYKTDSATNWLRQWKSRKSTQPTTN